MENIEEFLERFLKDLAALPEEKMRLDLLGRRLNELGADKAAFFIDLLYKKEGDLVAVAARALFFDPEGIRNAIGSELYAGVRASAVKARLPRVRALFTDLPPHKKGPYGYDKEEEAKMEFITLGQRREMSKRPIKNLIDRLLSDPDPMVVSNLLNNPRITEKEVLKIASKRPNSERILKLIAVHKVWSKRYDVVKAISLNPYSSPRVSIALLEVLLVQDLEDISEDKTIHPLVKKSAKELLEIKRGKKGR